MELPLLIQMQIDLTAQAHSREIAQGFAKLRAKLLPEPKPSRVDMAFMFANAFSDVYLRGAGLQAALYPSQNAMMQLHPLQAANTFWTEQRPMQSLFGGLGL